MMWRRTPALCVVFSLALGAACERASPPVVGPQPGRILGSAQAADAATAQVPNGTPARSRYTQTSAGVSVQSDAPTIRLYKDHDAWFGENRENSTLLALGKILGDDYFVHPLADLATGIPAGTAVVYIPSNGFGDVNATAEESSDAAQASLTAFLATGGVLIVDLGDNDFFGGYHAPGLSGTPDYVFPNPADDATLAPAAVGPDGILGTADDHRVVIGPDGLPGTADDLTNSNIDMCCSVAHGNLTAGATLPAGATVLATAVFNGTPEPVMAEYDFNGGHVIVETFTKEFGGWEPPGTGPSRFLTNLLFYALNFQPALAIAIDIKPGDDQNPINLRSKGVIPVAILTTQMASGDAVDFDASTVDPATVHFGPGAASAVQDDKLRFALEDVDHDGDLDAIMHFDTQAAGLSENDTRACLSGATLTGVRFAGCDNVKPISGPEHPPKPSGGGATATAIAFAPEPGPFANQVFLGDDQTSGLLPIGFDFTFFGATYSQFNISSNGFIGFDAGMSQGCCSGRPIPQLDGIENIIAAAWTDLYPPGGGAISWETRGTRPHRRLIVNYDHMPWCCEFGGNRVTTQIILYEGSNNIEVHTTHQDAGHIYTQGVENADGTVAAFLEGRVAAIYGLDNDGVRFTFKKAT